MRTGQFFAVPAFIVCTIVLFALGACSDPQADKAQLALGDTKLSGTVKISGSTTLAPLVRVLAEDFRKLHPGVEFDIQEGGSGKGLKDVKAGKSVIGMVSRVLTTEESDWLPFVIARDGLAVLIRGDNPVASLTNAQVAGIFTKATVNWRQLGGTDTPIYVIAASPAAGSTEIFLHSFHINQAAMRSDILADALGDRFTALTGNPGAITYGSLGDAERRAIAGGNIKLLPHSGMAATSANLAAGRYSLAKPLSLVTLGLPSGPAKAFIDYALSPAAVAAIKRFDFVPYRD